MSNILDQIDGALSDYAVSADAMRWAPDQEVDDSPLDSLSLTLQQASSLPLGDTLFDLTPAPLLKPGMLIRITRAGADPQVLRVVRELDDGRWQLRPSTPARPLDARYRLRQRNRRRRR